MEIQSLQREKSVNPAPPEGGEVAGIRLIRPICLIRPIRLIRPICPICPICPIRPICLIRLICPPVVSDDTI